MTEFQMMHSSTQLTSLSSTANKKPRYTEFIGNPTGTIFVATNREHKFLLHQRSNTPNMSSNLSNFRQLNVTENCSNFT